jgi:hypothetical protein
MRSDVFSRRHAVRDGDGRRQSRRDVRRRDVGDSARPSALGHRIKADLPRDLAALLRRCLEKAPADRFASAREVAAIIEKLKRDVEAGGARLPRRSRCWRS